MTAGSLSPPLCPLSAAEPSDPRPRPLVVWHAFTRSNRCRPRVAGSPVAKARTQRRTTILSPPSRYPAASPCLSCGVLTQAGSAATQPHPSVARPPHPGPGRIDATWAGCDECRHRWGARPHAAAGTDLASRSARVAEPSPIDAMVPSGICLPAHCPILEIGRAAATREKAASEPSACGGMPHRNATPLAHRDTSGQAGSSGLKACSAGMVESTR